jgi:taspase (threonine aspartase 1)
MPGYLQQRQISQTKNSQPSQSQLSTKIDNARERFRQFRRDFIQSIGKSQQCKIEIIPSPFFNNPDPWSIFPPMTIKTPFYQPQEMSSAFSYRPVMDGPAEPRRPRQPPPGVSAIFVHAGAGYHSTTNEHIHLGACNE